MGQAVAARTALALMGLAATLPAAAGAVHGPIRASEDGRRFVDRDGRPFFWLGDTAWPLFAQYTKDQAEAYLADRGQKGFTVIQGVLAWGLGTGFENKTPIANANGDKPWLNDDPRTPNDAYFRHVDHMLPTWGYYVNDTAVLDARNARAYGRWLGARYQGAPNVVWVNGGDRIATGFEDVYRELARGLREGDGGAHLVTYHPCGWRSSSQYFHGDDWLGFDMIETWTEWSKVYPQGPITPLIVRRQAWWTVMAGGFPTYGQDQMWRMQPGWERTCSFRGDRVLVYLSSQCTVVLHLDKIAAKNARVTWIDPATGERGSAGTFRTGNLNGKPFPDGQTQSFTVPGHWEDAVLLLEGAE
jgi:hypothetical protein